ncbi:hypothetical protein EYF80_025965 [Liparis tanakae]|uniref:Uncharacterized protein n=1 Tax=Liparis tanakae TaxID=230148 RepID=A0A4Z2HFK6_9TELE|nr:hypothetical protein EYF80_025965 [Liparis tanakae]
MGNSPGVFLSSSMTSSLQMFLDASFGAAAAAGSTGLLLLEGSCATLSQTQHIIQMWLSRLEEEVGVDEWREWEGVVGNFTKWSIASVCMRLFGDGHDGSDAAGTAAALKNASLPTLESHRLHAAILCQSQHLRWWQDCDLPCGRGGQTGKGGVGREEDYGIEEGVSYFSFFSSISVMCNFNSPN